MSAESESGKVAWRRVVILEQQLAAAWEALVTVRELREHDQKALAERKKEKPQSAMWVSPATALNAAIDHAVAAEHEALRWEKQEHAKIHRELAATREKVQTLVDALKRSREYISDSGYFDDKSPLIRVIDAALAKVGKQ